jgi:hypothetical protein
MDFPLKYLGKPLSVVNKPPKTGFQPLIDKMANKLPNWKGNLMNRSGWLVLVKSTLSAMPVYISVSIGLPPWALKAIIKIMKAFLWMGMNVLQGGMCLVAWSRVQ